MKLESLTAKLIENNEGSIAHGKLIFKETYCKAVEHKVPIDRHKIYLFTLQLVASISEL